MYVLDWQCMHATHCTWLEVVSALSDSSLARCSIYALAVIFFALFMHKAHTQAASHLHARWILSWFMPLAFFKSGWKSFWGRLLSYQYAHTQTQTHAKVFYEVVCASNSTMRYMREETEKFFIICVSTNVHLFAPSFRFISLYLYLFIYGFSFSFFLLFSRPLRFVYRMAICSLIRVFETIHIRLPGLIENACF